MSKKTEPSTDRAAGEIPSGVFLNVLQGHRQWLSVKAVCERLNLAGFDAVLAGGCVRDALLGVEPKDFDVATSAPPDQVESCFKNTLSIGKSFGVIVVNLEEFDPTSKPGFVEVATFRKDGEYSDGRHPANVIFSDRGEDARRRDFTVNALFYDPIGNRIIDYVGGRIDLEKRVLRVVGRPEERFAEDKLRLLRAVRFCGQLDFAIEKNTEDAIRVAASGLKVVSRERIRDEIDKLLMARTSLRGFSALNSLGLSEPVFQNWSGQMIPPNPKISNLSTLDTRRLSLFWPAFISTPPERIRERLHDWKYGRSFIELSIWTLINKDKFRPNSTDPTKYVRSRKEIIEQFEICFSEFELPRPTPNEIEWMDALELWTTEKASLAAELLDLVDRKSSIEARSQREEALRRRGLALGNLDSERAKAEDLFRKTGGAKLSGPVLGRELRRLNRAILLR